MHGMVLYILKILIIQEIFTLVLFAKITIITSPLLYLILFIYGIFIITKNLSKNLLNLKNNNLWNNFEELYCFYSIIIIFSTIIIIITELNSTIYNGWRQIYFIYPSIIFICVYGLNKLLKFKNYKNLVFFIIYRYCLYYRMEVIKIIL